MNAIGLLIGTCAEQPDLDDRLAAEHVDPENAAASAAQTPGDRQSLAAETERLRAAKKQKQAARVQAKYIVTCYPKSPNLKEKRLLDCARFSKICNPAFRQRYTTST